MLTVAILAAGKGTRMASTLPKVLHKLSGKTLLQRVINSCNELKPDKIFIIVGHKSKEVEDSVLKNKNIHFIVQNPQKGTGHAIQVLSQQVKKHEGKLMVLNGDVPLIAMSTQVVSGISIACVHKKAVVVVLSVVVMKECGKLSIL